MDDLRELADAMKGVVVRPSVVPIDEGFQRIMASVIDVVLVVAGQLVLAVILGQSQIADWIGYAAIATWMLVPCVIEAVFSASPGMLSMKLRVARADFSEPSVGQVVGRMAVRRLWLLVASTTGFLMAARGARLWHFSDGVFGILFPAMVVSLVLNVVGIVLALNGGRSLADYLAGTVLVRGRRNAVPDGHAFEVLQGAVRSKAPDDDF